MKKQSFEFIAMMAALMAMAALSIDAILPALSTIGSDLKVVSPLNSQMLITAIFLGLGLGQLVFGPLSDSFGRKPMIYIGLSIFILASIFCISVTSMEFMLIGRVFQGIGLAAPRTISSSMIRDSYEGDAMARVMSFVTVIFIIIPTVAPLIGSVLLLHYSWHSIFYFQLIFSVIVGFWFMLRQSETLIELNKIPFKYSLFIDGLREVLKSRTALVYTLISGFIMGSFMLYLSASEKIFVIQYGLKDSFPYYFAGLALSFGAATFLNGTLVLRYGMERMIRASLISFIVTACLYLFVNYGGPNPSVEILVFFLLIQFLSLGFLFGNLNAIRLQPLGHIAGVGAAITGFISTVLAVLIGSVLGAFIEDTVHVLFSGFAFCGLCSLLLIILFRLSNKKAPY